MSSEAKPILLLAETGFVMRNLLLGTFADEVTRHRPLVVAVRNPDDQRLKDLVADKPIKLVPYLFEPTQIPRSRLDHLKNPQSFMFRFKVAEKGTDGVHTQARFEDSNHSLIGRIGTDIIYQAGRLLTRTGLMGKFDALFLDRFKRRDITARWREVIANIDPAVVVSTTLTLCTKLAPSHDLAPVLAAQSLGIPTGTLVQSWDNLSSKTAVLPTDLTRYWTWSNLMTRELVELYPRVAPSSVQVVGSPQFDFHRPEIAEDRTTFFRRHGLDPARPLVVFGTGTQIRFPHEPKQILEIARALRAAAPNLQMLVRLHPKDNGSRWAAIPDQLAEVGLVVQHTAPPVHMDLGGFVPAREFYRDQVSTLTHAAVVVNSSSTISVDAAILDRPIVCLAYDVVPDPKFPEGFSLAAIQTTHFAPLVATGGMTVAHSAEECVAAIQRYVADPALERAERKKIVELVAGVVDGGAGRRLADEVVRLTSSATAPTA